MATGEIEYISFGTGSKPLVMIQGLNTNGFNGAEKTLPFMYRLFTKDYTVYLFDRKKPLSNDLTIKNLSDDIALSMDKLNIKDAYILGVSQGGMIAQSLTISRPDLVNKLVLALTLAKNNDTVQAVIDHWIQLTEQNKIQELIKDMTEKMYSANYIKKYKLFMPLLTILQKPKDIQRFIILAKACLTCNTYENLNEIKCPVLVIGAGEDKVVGAKASEEIAEKLQCEIFMYENLGHAAYEEAKDFNQRIYDFFQKYNNKTD